VQAAHQAASDLIVDGLDFEPELGLIPFALARLLFVCCSGGLPTETTRRRIAIGLLGRHAV